MARTVTHAQMIQIVDHVRKNKKEFKGLTRQLFASKVFKELGIRMNPNAVKTVQEGCGIVHDEKRAKYQRTTDTLRSLTREHVRIFRLIGVDERELQTLINFGYGAKGSAEELNEKHADKEESEDQG